MDALEVKICRVRLGLTQWDLAQRVGLHPARISEMERGRREVSESVKSALAAIYQASAAKDQGLG